MKESIKKREEFRQYLIDQGYQKHVKTVSEKDLEKAEEKLYKGQVVATDGTINRYPLLTGVRCRIGVISTSYLNDSIERVFFISEREFVDEDAQTPREFFERIGKKSGVSNLLLASIMSYKEREIALQRPGEWKFIHGTLVPLELRTPRIGNGVFEACLELAKKIVENKKCVGIISGSGEADYVGSGIILEPGEYMWQRNISEYVQDQLDEGIGNESERQILEGLRDKYLSKIKQGVFRVGPKPYLFEAHEDYFDEAASLIIRDSMNQPFRGFSLLIDYADSMCHGMLASSDFTSMIERKMARIGGIKGLGYEISERLTRRR